MFSLRRLPATLGQSVRYSSTAAASSGVAPVPATTNEKSSSDASTAVVERPAGSVIQAGVINGMPDELHRRQVRIFRPSAPSTQSAKMTSHHWRIDWDILQGAGRWENPLMGWASSADYMQGTHVKFNTKEDAIHFCEKQGFEFYVQEPHKSKFKPKNYSSNYAYTNKPLRQVVTK